MRTIMTAILGGVVLACGCSKSPSESGKPGPAPASNSNSPSPPPSQTPAQFFGTAVISGRVTFEGTRPAPRKLAMTGDAVCTKAGDVFDESRMIAADGGVPHVFVYVKKGINGKYAVPSDAVVLDQKGCMYVPHVFGIQIGQTLTIRNSDPTAHNVHGLPKKNDSFNYSQSSIGMTNDATFSREEVMVKVKCDVHGWMSSYAGVLSHPFYDVTDDGGRFEIGRLPAGDYTVEVWHETFQRQAKQVTVKDGETLTLDFVYSKGAKP
ncbi:MAG TPA: carboxypeptidase regulatory-like domain-containing protein [Phycisphaerae bacterium]|nr:carboxypeptidase regulatory-like domain-containing protein [Phycisphaerae bacterium]